MKLVKGSSNQYDKYDGTDHVIYHLLDDWNTHLFKPLLSQFDAVSVHVQIFLLALGCSMNHTCANMCEYIGLCNNC